MFLNVSVTQSCALNDVNAINISCQYLNCSIISGSSACFVSCSIVFLDNCINTSVQKNNVSLSNTSLILERTNVSLTYMRTLLGRTNVSLSNTSLILDRTNVSLTYMSSRLGRTNVSLSNTSLILDRTNVSLTNKSTLLGRTNVSLSNTSFILFRKNKCYFE